MCGPSQSHSEIPSEDDDQRDSSGIRKNLEERTSPRNQTMKKKKEFSVLFTAQVEKEQNQERRRRRKRWSCLDSCVKVLT